MRRAHVASRSGRAGCPPPPSSSPTPLAAARRYGYSSNRDFCGHGIGKVFHTSPNILHVRNSEPGRMQVGNVFTIEPMICEGTSQHVMWSDQWTATT